MHVFSYFFKIFSKNAKICIVGIKMLQRPDLFEFKFKT